jgi:alpha-D-ribose 1-methylphosphonate 5-triphosphate diphosphatase
MSETRPAARSRERETLVVENAHVVAPTDVVEGGVRIEGGEIAAVGPDVSGGADRRIDAAGRYVLPGLVDLHGDDIEGHLFPRSGAKVETPMALAAADRATVAAGITTKFHAISFEDNPEKDRSPELAKELVDAIQSADGLLADHRIHARCEVTEPGGVSAIESVLDRDRVDLVSVMAHVPGKGQFQDVERFREYYENSDNLSVEDAERLIDRRAGVDESVLTERIQRVVAAAAEADVPVASHDDESPPEVDRLAEHGVDISEYPVTLEAARRATERGLTTTMGAPNLIRGGSQWGNLATADAIEAAVVDALVADYHPQSLLAAPFVDTGEPLPERVARVTRNPADAVGLEDRGRLVPGARADLIVVDAEPTPTVQRAIRRGRDVYRAEER